MIVRVWLIAGTLLIGIAWYLTVSFSPPIHQGSARSAIDEYRSAGLMPAAGSLTISKEIGPEVFEVPKTDAEHAGDQPMAGMGHGNMPKMNMKQMPAMTMEKMPGMTAEKGRAEEKMSAMTMGKMPGMTDEKGHGGMMTEGMESMMMNMGGMKM